MLASRGMGKIRKCKVPRPTTPSPRTVQKRDGTTPVKLLKSGGKVRKHGC